MNARIHAMPRAPRAGSVVQPHIPGLARADKQAKPPKRSEAALQQQTRQTLGLLGYASLATGQGRPRVTCPCGCGHSFTPTGYMGNDTGVPDVLFYRHAAAFPPVGIFVEMKGAATRVRPEQQALADAGRSLIAYSVKEAVEAVLAAETAMDAYRLDPGKREQIERLLRESGDKLL